MLNGFKDFCQEFITDVRVPDSARIGDVNEGWTIGTRWMFHERMLHNSPYVTSATGNAGSSRRSLHNVDVARDSGRIDDPVSRDLLGEAYMLELVGEVIQHRIAEGISTGKMSDQAASVGRLYSGVSTTRLTSIAFELAGSSATAWDESDGAAAEIGNDYLLRQVSTLGGGTTEMARNVVAERVLGMPRELSYDRNTPFRDVPKGPPAK
jgi:alkylation response protein AidB-like acyl-CoA dehydrogenase